MNIPSFTLNDRFRVEPDLNLVRDLDQDKEFRLEARLMKLLCMLAGNKEKLVTRETITGEIWDNYGNTDESLTQAISYLRKVLSDQEKKIIETVPKKGYVFRATVNTLEPDPTSSSQNNALPKQKSQKYIVGILLLGVAISVIVILSLRSGKNKKSADSPDVKLTKEIFSGSKSPSDSTITEIAFPGLSEEKENKSNYLNTVTTTDSLGTKYRLVIIGDKRPEFYVNDSLQSNQQPYDGLINRMAKELWKRQKEAEKK